MALTVAEDLVALRQRCSDIERHLTNIDIALVRIEAALAPKPPAPEPKPPAWATPQGNFGSSYTGPPSVPQTGAAGIAGVTPDAAGNWRDPSGHLRDGSGAYVTGRSTEPIIGPSRTEAHKAAVRMADELFRDRKEPE